MRSPWLTEAEPRGQRVVAGGEKAAVRKWGMAAVRKWGMVAVRKTGRGAAKAVERVEVGGLRRVLRDEVAGRVGLMTAGMEEVRRVECAASESQREAAGQRARLVGV